MAETLWLLWGYTWRFALYGAVFGSLFGAGFGLLIAAGAPGGPAAGIIFGGGFGGAFGLGMGIATGVFLGIVARLFFYEQVDPFTYRLTMVAGAFLAAFVTGAIAIQIVFSSGITNADWEFALLMGSAGGIGAAIAAYRISGRYLRVIRAATLQPTT